MADAFEVLEDSYLDTYNFELNAWEPELVASKGETVYRYKGWTYGVISPLGVAVTREPNATPFFEVFARNLRALDE